MVLFGEKWLYWGKRGCIWAKLFYSVKCGCNRAKVVVFGQKWLISGKSGSIRAKVVLFGQNILFLGKVFILGQNLF